jgi:predicted Rossmann fold nucleotide-binding protein DprA/Smf involved in DNA uptake
MNGKEQGFLLLTSTLGDPERKPLTVAQFRTLAQRARTMERPLLDRELQAEDLMALGYDRSAAERIIRLLSQTEQLNWYVAKGRKMDCYPITRLGESYPAALRSRLKMDAPGCLWAKGDVSILKEPAIALVGSRDLNEENLAFAREAGRQAALQGITLISGNARGADREAQQAALEQGGKVISIVADQLQKQPLTRNVLYLSQEGFDLGFSSQRALSRNRVIHSLGSLTLIAQCGNKKGGTWSGTTDNLRHGFSPVFCFDDGSSAVKELTQMGATAITTGQLTDLAKLLPEQGSLF